MTVIYCGGHEYNLLKGDSRLKLIRRLEESTFRYIGSLEHVIKEFRIRVDSVKNYKIKKIEFIDNSNNKEVWEITYTYEVDEPALEVSDLESTLRATGLMVMWSDKYKGLMFFDSTYFTDDDGG